MEKQGDFIRFLIKEVQEASFTNIEDVVAFVKWLDEELSFLVCFDNPLRNLQTLNLSFIFYKMAALLYAGG